VGDGTMGDRWGWWGGMGTKPEDGAVEPEARKNTTRWSCRPDAGGRSRSCTPLSRDRSHNKGSDRVETKA
jgi:hypothetical protein